MLCNTADLRQKDVINICNGENLGFVDDVQLDTTTHRISALILYGKPRFFGIFGMKDALCIPFEQVQLIGKDVILVSLNGCLNSTKNKK